jgi:hypothetical protein
MDFELNKCVCWVLVGAERALLNYQLFFQQTMKKQFLLSIPNISQYNSGHRLIQRKPG